MVLLYSHTILIIRNLLVIDAVRYLNIRVPLLGMKHDLLTSRGSRLEPRYPLGVISAYSYTTAIHLLFPLSVPHLACCSCIFDSYYCPASPKLPSKFSAFIAKCWLLFER